MRQAINTYQDGGYVRPDVPFLGAPPVPTQQASPVQPPPGPAGPTPTPQPPIQSYPAEYGNVPPSMQTAIRAGVEPIAPAPEAMAEPPPPPTPEYRPPGLPQSDASVQADEEARHAAEQSQREATLFDPKNLDTVFSHRGDFRQIARAPNETRKEDDPRWANVQVAKADLPKYDAKTQKRYQTQLNRLETQITNEVNAKNKNLRADHLRQEKEELAKIDAQPLDPTKTATLDATLADNPFTKLEQQYQAPAATPQATQANQRKYAGSIFKTIDDPNLRSQYTHNVIALNRNLNPSIAANIVAELAQPVPPGQKGLNGATGPAAAWYDPVGKDLIGNRLIKTRAGTIRIAKDDFDAIAAARKRGYDLQREHDAKLQKAREEEAKPGWVARQLKGAIDTLK